MIRTWPALFKGLGRLAVAWRATCLIFLKNLAESGGFEPLRFHVPRFSRPVGDHSPALSVEQMTGLGPATTGFADRRLSTSASSANLVRGGRFELPLDGV